MASGKDRDLLEAGYLWDPNEPWDETMPSFFFRVQVTPESEAELAEVSAPDLFTAFETLALWCPELHRLDLEGVWTHPPGHA
ncbi:MAG: hypothetical protein ACE5HK_04115 [Candidatus Methylomirabilales bacterium]